MSPTQNLTDLHFSNFQKNAAVNKIWWMKVNKKEICKQEIMLNKELDYEAMYPNSQVKKLLLKKGTWELSTHYN